MRIGAADAVEELVAHGLADEDGPRIEQLLHAAGVTRGRHLRGEPFRAAAAGPLAGDVVHVLHPDGEAGEGAGSSAGNGCLEIVRNEKAASHAAPRWPRYQSRIFSPLQQATPGRARISSN